MEQENIASQPEKSNFSVEQVISSPVDLLKKSIKVYQMGFVDLLKMLLIPLLGMIPMAVVMVLYGGSIFAFKDPGMARLVTTGILAILMMLAFIIMIYVGVTAKIGMYRLIKNRLESVGSVGAKNVKEIFNESKKYFWKFIGVSFLTGLFVILWSFLFIIPGIIFAVYYSFSIWALVCEDYEATAALKRSKELVKGYWWSVVGRFLFFGLVYIAFVLVLSIPYLFMGDTAISEIAWDLIMNIFSFIISPLLFIYNYFIYNDLVKIKGASKIEK